MAISRFQLSRSRLPSVGGMMPSGQLPFFLIEGKHRKQGSTPSGTMGSPVRRESSAERRRRQPGPGCSARPRSPPVTTPTSSKSMPPMMSGWMLPSRSPAWRSSWYDTSAGPCSCSYIALSTQATSGSGGGRNPVRSSPHRSSSQPVVLGGASGHRSRIVMASCRRCRPARTPGPDAEPKRLSWVNRRRRGFSALRSLGRLQSSRIRLDLIDSEHREMVTPPLVGSLPGPSSRPGTERDALRGRRRSSAGVGKAVAFAALALITTVIGIWQVGSSAAEYEQYQSARPCRTEPVEWGDASHCHEFRARVTEKIPARRNRGIRQNPRLEIEALDHDQPYKRSFPVTTVFQLVEVRSEERRVGKERL